MIKKVIGNWLFNGIHYESDVIIHPSFINSTKLKSLETYKKIIVYRFLYELNKCY